MKQNLFIILFFLISINIYAANNERYDEYFKKGNEYYKSNQFDSALSMYNNILQKGIKNPEVYFNVSNCYANLNQTGKALLYLYKAQRLNPSDKDILDNIKFLNSKIKNKRPFEIDLIQYSLNSITAMFIITSLLFFIILSLIIFLAPSLLKMILIYGTVILFFINIGLGIWLYHRVEYEIINKQAVIVADKADVMSGPGDTFLKKTEIYEGLDVDIIEERYGFYRVKVFGKEAGWISKDTAEII